VQEGRGLDSVELDLAAALEASTMTSTETGLVRKLLCKETPPLDKRASPYTLGVLLTAYWKQLSHVVEKLLRYRLNKKFGP
jgi:hypothetical protein